MINMNCKKFNRKEKIVYCKSYIACNELDGRISAVEYRRINSNINCIILSIDILDYFERLNLCFMPESFLGLKKDYGNKIVDVENYIYDLDEIDLLLIKNLKSNEILISPDNLKNIANAIEEELLGKSVIVYPEVINDNLIRYFFTIKEYGV